MAPSVGAEVLSNPSEIRDAAWYLIRFAPLARKRYTGAVMMRENASASDTCTFKQSETATPRYFFSRHRSRSA